MLGFLLLSVDSVRVITAFGVCVRVLTVFGRLCSDSYCFRLIVLGFLLLSFDCVRVLTAFG